MKKIGGYFGLEENKSMEARNFHKNFHALNSARNALAFFLKSQKIKKLQVPYYICNDVIVSLQNLNIELIFYNINNKLEIIKKGISSNTPTLYVNYMGLKDKYISTLSNKFTKLIVDNAQAFYSSPVPNSFATIYSPRKFLGVPDGGFLSTLCNIDTTVLPLDISYNNSQHLLKRIELEPEEGYKDFIKSEDNISKKPISKMSKLTFLLLNQINHFETKNKRLRNFKKLHTLLKGYNSFNIPVADITSPLCYPILNCRENLRDYLISKKIFTPKYWTFNGSQNFNNSEIKVNKYLVAIPIDQRYSIEDMSYIASTISNYLEK